MPELKMILAYILWMRETEFFFVFLFACHMLREPRMQGANHR